METGIARFRQHEELVASILTNLFVPPLDRPRLQVSTADQLERRDLIFANNATEGLWAYLITRFKADVVLVEAKNKSGPIDTSDVTQIRDYLLREGLSDFGVLVGRQPLNPTGNQLAIRTLEKQGKMVLALSDRDLERMCWLKSAGEDPSIVLQEKRLDLQLKV